MATTIINPTPSVSTDNGMGFFIGGFVFIVFAVLFFVYALPYIRGFTGGTVQVNVPKSIDVNVQQSK